MARARAITIRKIVGFVVLLIAVLSFGAWMLHLQEQRLGAKDEDEDAFLPLALDVGTNLMDLAYSVPTSLLARALVEGTDTPSQRLDAEAMAAAVRELRLATQYYQARELSRAELHVQKALQIWPDMSAALRLLGVIYTQRRQFDQAFVLFEDVLATDPFSAETLNNLATLYIQKKMPEKAEELLNTALELRPGYFYAYLNLALLYLLSGRHDLAADNFELALDQNPNIPGARNNLAVCYLRLGRVDDARGQFQQIINDDPDTASAYFNMAITYSLEGNLDEAMKWIQRGAAYCPPTACQQFLSDPDFGRIRNHPRFEEFIQGLYPDIPAPANL